MFDYLTYSGCEACDRDPCNFNSRGADSLPESIPMIVRCKRGHGRFDAEMMATGIQTNPARSRRSNIRQCTKASARSRNRLPWHGFARTAHPAVWSHLRPVDRRMAILVGYAEGYNIDFRHHL